MKYEVYLKTARGIMPLEADKFCLDEPGYVVFYARPAPGEKFEEVQRFALSSVAKIKEF